MYYFCVADMTLPLDQDWFLDRMQKIGYMIPGDGHCFGMAHMAMQAFFAHDMETFNRRLETINGIPLEDFENNFHNLVIKKQEFISAGNKPTADKIAQTINIPQSNILASY